MFGSLGPGQRFVLRLPDAWNGKLVAAGTPALRSEFASDLIWSEYVLARGYAFVASNKGVAFNGILEDAPGDRWRYGFPFDLPGIALRGKSLRFGALEPEPMRIARWNDDYAATIEAASALIARETGRVPERTYAVGLSNGGAQVRSLLETRPELADGGVEWASVYWTPERNLLTLLPGFLRAMPRYIASGYRDATAHAEIVALGFPPDRTQPDAAHPSLWADHYSNVLPFYNDVTTFLFARLLDPAAPESFGLEERAAYVPSAQARAEIATFAHRGNPQKPLIGIAGSADVFVTPEHHLGGYAAAVRAAGAARNYRAYLIDDATHVDGFVGFGYNLQQQLPFAWEAFEQLVRIVECGATPSGDGTVRAIASPAEIAAAG